MENNLEDVLVDNFEDKNPKKSNKRIILIVIASVVLLGVLGVSSLMLAKQEPTPKNLEFDELEIELEKLSPPIEESEPKEEKDNIDRLIADIKSRQAQEETKPNIVEKPNGQKPLAEREMPNITPAQPVSKEEHAPKTSALPSNSKSNQKIQNQPNQQEPKTKDEALTQQTKKQTAKKMEEKTITKHNQEKTHTSSASALFQSVEKSIPKGYYLQVGVFGGKPQEAFLNKLKTYPYKIDKIQRGGKVLTRYLIGPFNSRDMAQSKIEQVTQNINKPVIVEIR